MITRITTNVDEIAALLDAVGRRQLPFATALGINRTMEEIQIEARRKLPGQFTLRTSGSRRFLEGLYHIRKEDFANKQKLRGYVGIQGSPGTKGFTRRAAAVLAKFQQAGQRRYRPGAEPLLYPADVLRPSPGAVIPRTLYPRALGLLGVRRIEGGFTIRGARHRVSRGGENVVSLRGKRRTFALDPRFHPASLAYGVWQRERREGTQRLWLYVQVQRWPKRISFVEDALALAKARLRLNIEGQLAYATNELKQLRAQFGAKVARARGAL